MQIFKKIIIFLNKKKKNQKKLKKNIKNFKVKMNF